MFKLIQINNVFYILPSLLTTPNDVVYCIGTQEECETTLSMFNAGYMDAVPLG